MGRENWRLDHFLKILRGPLPDLGGGAPPRDDTMRDWGVFRGWGRGQYLGVMELRGEGGGGGQIKTQK